MHGLYTVDGLVAQKLQIVGNVGIGGIEQGSTFMPQDAVGNVALAIIRTSQVVVHHRALSLFSQLGVERNGPIVLLMSVGTIGQCLYTVGRCFRPD